MKCYHIVGYREYKGEFEGKPYSGFYLHCTTTDVPDSHMGEAVTELKCKSRYGYTPRVGDDIAVEYGPYGIESIGVV